MTAAALVRVDCSVVSPLRRRVAEARSLVASGVAAAARHPQRRHVLALVGVSVVSMLATASSPLLISRAPFVLALLAPRFTFLSLAATQTSVVPFVVLGTARLLLTDPLHYAIGRGGGSTGPRRRWWPAPVRRLIGSSAWWSRSRLAARPACCVAVLLRPNGLSLLWAGSLGLPRLLVAVLDVVGTCAYLVAVHAGAGAIAG